MRFDQILVSASPGDAVTGAAMELRDLLRQAGPSEIYARYVDRGLVGEVNNLADFRRRRSHNYSSDVLVFHASIGEPELIAMVASRPERLVVMYHNFSPWERFLPFDPQFAGLLAAGRIELASLAEKARLALTVSEFNARELRSSGFRNVKVVPIVVDVERLQSVIPHEPTANHMRCAVDGPVILFVGQMLPHKRPDLLLEAYAVLVTNLNPEAHLIMVGPHRLPRFSEHLVAQTSELNLSQAWFTGSVSLPELVAFYRSADLFITLSEHEGFCVPLIEAMGFEVPVIARAAAAIPETMGDAGILLPDRDDPLLAAEAMLEVLDNKELRNDLVDRGRRRRSQFDPDLARAQLVNDIFEVAEG